MAPGHIAKHGIENLDSGTLRHLHSFAKHYVEDNDRLRAEVVKHNGEEFAVKEWDSHFAEDRAADAQAMIDITTELEKRRHTL